MLFLTYDFVFFAALFYALYYLSPRPALRLAVILCGSIAFQFHFGGWVSVVPVSIIALATFAAGRMGAPRLLTTAIALCAASLIFYKYSFFFTGRVIGAIAPDLGTRLQELSKTVVPAIVPLGVSFFTFEFVHYLVDLQRGGQPIRRLRDFLAFALFWPTMVAGPIKRYQNFIPSLYKGLAGPTATDAMVGLQRIAIGCVKKWAADNLTGWIEFIEPQFAAQTIGTRWLFLVALAFRILLDFSGYSDMAIGFARMMGIAVPENFNWPYLARTPMEFWQRWHISLSSWIRDYIYIPLGGNRLGLPRRLLNALAAMAICGLWHGPDWNFVIWGLYHGTGLGIGALLQGQLRFAPTLAPVSLSAAATRSSGYTEMNFAGGAAAQALRLGAYFVTWAVTMLFVGFGWLLFFYPLDKALTMARLLLM
jgi:alginate O-acetyltransferase complex protein AlgI